MSTNQADLFGAVLASVSRSFYLTIRALPRELRRPVGLAYLLARTSDTIADSTHAEAAERIAALQAFQAAIHHPGTGLSQATIAKLQAGVSDPDERLLLEKTGTLVQLLHDTHEGDRAEIVRVLDEILHGQMLDADRFSGGPLALAALPNSEALDAYTFSVAGCVGEFWTRICTRHLAHYSKIGRAEMIGLGIAFGKALQLVNILRDLPADVANGRCYLPADALAELGLKAESLKSSPALARPVINHWLSRARSQLEEGFVYIEAVRPWRIRLACFLPWALGIKTLALIEEFPPLETSQRVKVPRKEVYRLVVWGVFIAFSNPLLRFYYRRVAETKKNLG